MNMNRLEIIQVHQINHHIIILHHKHFKLLLIKLIEILRFSKIERNVLFF
jgi:hypothetical protein